MKGEDAVGQEVDVVYRASDFRALYGACKRCRRNLLWVVLTLPILATIFEFAGGTRGVDLLYRTLPFLIIAVLVVLGVFFVSPLLQVRARRRNSWGGPITIGLNEQGIATRHPSMDAQFHWAAIQDIVLKGDRLFLFTSPECAIILPRRAFSSENEFDNWVNQARDFWRAGQRDRQQAS